MSAPSSTFESVTLTIPGERRSIGIARLFVGGLATRLGLGYEAMADLQLALESVLLTTASRAELRVEARIDGGSMSIVVGPLDRDPLVPDAAHPEALGLERLLGALVAGAHSYEQDGFRWLRLDARTATADQSRA